MKKISIVIPVYGAEKYIAATVESAIQQTYKNIEILIIDDASPDRSIEICQQFADSRIKIIHQENRGLPGARNTGIRHATGECIAFLDADDIWLPDKVKKHVEHLNNSPNIGVSFSYSAFINEDGQRLGIYQTPKCKEITLPYLLCRNPVGNGSSGVIRREAFEAIEFEDDLHGTPEKFYFDERLRCTSADATDLDCWLRIAALTRWKIEGIPEALTLYRVNSNGLSANMLKQLDAIEAVINKTESYAPTLFHQAGSRAKSSYQRHIARRAVTMKSSVMAVEMIHKAIQTDWRILIEEPQRTYLTLAAAYALYLLPLPLYNQLEATALNIAGAIQRRRMLADARLDSSA